MQAEIDGRHDHYEALKVKGEKMVASDHVNKEVITTSLAQLTDSWVELNTTWDKRRKLLAQCYDLQVYEEYADKAESWLAGKEAFLNNDDLGVSDFH
jgi:hypothetical protein